MKCVPDVKMNRLTWIGAAFVACALVGCGPQAPKTASNEGTKPDPGGISATTGGLETAPDATGTQTTPDGTKPPLDPNNLKPSDVEKMKPVVPPISIPAKGTEGWQKNELTPAMVGDKMDKALAGLKGAMGFVSVSFDLPKVGKLTGKGKIGIENSNTFYADYFTPETKSAAIRIVSNGSKRMELTPKGWVNLNPGTSAKEVTFNDEETAKWKSEFWTEMMDGYRHGTPAWKPIMEAWQSGKGGYSSTIESKTINVSGAKHKIHRIVSTSKQNSNTEIEVIVDADRYLPVAVRVIDKLPDGTVNKSMWSVIWAFGGKHDPKLFKLPNL